MTPSPLVSVSRDGRAVVVSKWGLDPEQTRYLSAESARQLAADLIRAAERVEAVERIVTQRNLTL